MASRIEPATFRFVAQRLNKLRYGVLHQVLLRRGVQHAREIEQHIQSFGSKPKETAYKTQMG
jgi:hypothetical protein